jgi:enoyl-CoA hydratase
MNAVYNTIIASSEEGIGQIIFNRPEALNAFNKTLMSEVTAALKCFENDSAIRAVVVSGSGRAFSAGFDLKEAAVNNYTTAAQWRLAIEADFEFIMQFWDCRIPTISALHGFCIGGGLELALACDISIAGVETLLGEPEVRFGSGIVAMLVPWMVGPKFAKDILLTGNDRIPAVRAHHMGLVTEVVDTGKHIDRALEKAGEIAQAAPLSVALTKRAINRGFDIRGMRSALLAAADVEVIIESSAGEERKEFNRIRSEKGLKEAIAWRDARYRAVPDLKNG